MHAAHVRFHQLSSLVAATVAAAAGDKVMPYTATS
jgi:hypothetical protein